MQGLSLFVDGTSLPGGEIDEQEGKTQIALFVWEEGGFDCSPNDILWKSQAQQCLLNHNLKIVANRTIETLKKIVKRAVKGKNELYYLTNNKDPQIIKNKK